VRLGGVDSALAECWHQNPRQIGKHKGSKWEATGGILRHLAARQQASYPFIFVGFWKLGETSGKLFAYVDIVGVTGSIPVAPTIGSQRYG
jgi:hypothetical protein